MSSETLIDPESEDIKISPGDSPSKSVSGSLKRSPVRLPAAIQGQKPGALPNQQVLHPLCLKYDFFYEETFAPIENQCYFKHLKG